MRVLVACEFSQIVTNAFRKKGHDAYSCDLLPTEGDPKYHIADDVMNHLDENWDMLIAHPSCTYLCNSGVSWLHKDKSRWDDLKIASKFFKDLLNCGINKICVENPVPHKYANLPKYTQLIQPFNFGHGERKATCLWLRNLPMLKRTTNVFDWNNFSYKIESGREQRIAKMSESENRWMERSRTFQGIADAMAEQWG